MAAEEFSLEEEEGREDISESRKGLENEERYKVSLRNITLTKKY